MLLDASGDGLVDKYEFMLVMLLTRKARRYSLHRMCSLYRVDALGARDARDARTYMHF
jgi:hypothetical protein